MSENEERDQAVFDLYLSKYTRSDSFVCQLYKLIAKADPVNRGKLRRSFPLHVAIWEEWYNAPNEETFFRNQPSTRGYFVNEQR